MRVRPVMLHGAAALVAAVLDFSALSVWANHPLTPQVGLVGVLAAAVLAPPRVAAVWVWVVGAVASLTTAYGFGVPLVAGLVAAGTVRTLAHEVLTNRSLVALAALVAAGSILAAVTLVVANRLEVLLQFPVRALAWSALDPRLVLGRAIGNVALLLAAYLIGRLIVRHR